MDKAIVEDVAAIDEIIEQMLRTNNNAKKKELRERYGRLMLNIAGGYQSAIDRVALTALEPLKVETEAQARRRRQVGTNPKGGHLDQNVVARKVDEKSRFYRVYWVAFKGRGRRIAHLVEFGTRPHWQPKRFGGVMHPGARAYPFFRPAYEAKKNEVLRVFGNQIWQIIEGNLVKGTKPK